MKNETIVLGTGCFWCSEALFNRLRGVISVTPGYAGGHKENPTYEEVCEGKTGHAEVAKIVFDPKVISFEKILEVFFSIHDPTSLNRQGNDVGTQYRSIILYTTKDQETKIKEVIKNFKDSGSFSKEIVTEIKPLENFYPAEDYHQNYYEKNSYAPYCQFVINPKLGSFSEKFADLLK